jgi:hypothetical protein
LGDGLLSAEKTGGGAKRGEKQGGAAAVQQYVASIFAF